MMNILLLIYSVTGRYFIYWIHDWFWYWYSFELVLFNKIELKIAEKKMIDLLLSWIPEKKTHFYLVKLLI